MAFARCQDKVVIAHGCVDSSPALIPDDGSCAQHVLSPLSRLKASTGPTRDKVAFCL